MRVTAKQVTDVTVELTRSNIEHVIWTHLYAMIELTFSKYHGAYLLNGKIYEWTDTGSGLDTRTTEFVRDATDLDKAVFTVLMQMNRPN
jgi:ABC-type arginine transport system ATPase subunit